MTELTLSPLLPTRDEAGRLSPAELVELLLADQRLRWRAGRPVPAEAYLELYPGLGADPERVLDLVYGEFLVRQELGQDPIRFVLDLVHDIRISMEKDLDLDRALLDLLHSVPFPQTSCIADGERNRLPA